MRHSFKYTTVLINKIISKVNGFYCVFVRCDNFLFEGGFNGYNDVRGQLEQSPRNNAVEEGDFAPESLIIFGHCSIFHLQLTALNTRWGSRALNVFYKVSNIGLMH